MKQEKEAGYYNVYLHKGSRPWTRYWLVQTPHHFPPVRALEPKLSAKQPSGLVRDRLQLENYLPFQQEVVKSSPRKKNVIINEGVLIDMIAYDCIIVETAIK